MKVLFNYFTYRLELWLNTGCSSKGPGFNFQHPYGSLQLSTTPGDLTPLYRHQCRQDTNAYKIE